MTAGVRTDIEGIKQALCLRLRTSRQGLLSMWKTCVLLLVLKTELGQGQYCSEPDRAPQACVPSHPFYWCIHLAISSIDSRYTLLDYSVYYSL